MDEWKDIPGFEGLYQINKNGKIKSLGNGLSTNPDNNVERIMKTRIKKTGYEHIKLSKNGKYYYHSIHQLLAITFLNHKPNGNTTVVDHINNIKNDNRLDNIQLITNRDNVIKSIDENNTPSKYIDIYKQKDGKWYVRFKTSKSKNFDTEQEALLYKNKIINYLYKNKIKN